MSSPITVTQTDVTRKIVYVLEGPDLPDDEYVYLLTYVKWNYQKRGRNFHDEIKLQIATVCRKPKGFSENVGHFFRNFWYNVLGIGAPRKFECYETVIVPFCAEVEIVDGVKRTHDNDLHVVLRTSDEIDEWLIQNAARLNEKLANVAKSAEYRARSIANLPLPAAPRPTVQDTVL